MEGNENIWWERNFIGAFSLDTVRSSKTAKSGLQMGVRRRRMGPNEIEPVEKQKLIVYKKTKPFLFLMYQTLLMYKFLRGTFYDAELTGPLPARLPLRR